jgi:hypothetical protein
VGEMKAQNSPEPKILERIRQLIDGLEETPRKVLLGGLIFFFIMAASTTLMLGYYAYQPQVEAFFQKATLTPTPTITPTPTATPQCVSPSLTLGTTIYPLDVTSLNPDGSLPASAPSPGTAWWVSNTFAPFVFILQIPPGTTDLEARLAQGDPLVVQWADCGREVYVLTQIQPGNPDEQALLAQAEPGLAVIIPASGETAGYVIRGQRPELINPPTPEPTSESAIMADITFEGTGLSDDQMTLQTSLTITNRGANPLTMTANDLSLTAEGEPPLSPLSVEPALPQVISPGGSLSLTITFANPGGHTAVLQVLDITVDLYY